jgi:hypothetical protein
MAINFTCRCGTALLAKDEHAGRHVVCPACKRESQVPFVVGGAPVKPSAPAGSLSTAWPFWSHPIVVVAAAVLSILVIAFTGFLIGRYTQAPAGHNEANNPNIVVLKETSVRAEPGRAVVADREVPSPTQDEEPAETSPADLGDDDSQVIGDFEQGSVGVVYINGDEVRKVPGLGKSRIVTHDSMVLIFPWEAYGTINDSYQLAYIPYVNAIEAGDPDGTDVLLKDEYAIRVKAGTTVRVTKIQSRKGNLMLLPGDDHGSRQVRIIEGRWKGKVVEIPTRNLRPVPKTAGR